MRSVYKISPEKFVLVTIFFVSLLFTHSCKKEECLSCYRVGPRGDGTTGIIQTTKTEMCGDGIDHLRSRGWLCQ